jgi:hypothetical protein
MDVSIEPHRQSTYRRIAEQRQLEHADSIQACLAIDMVVAWRVYHVAKLGRETPDIPCTVFFEEAEWKALLTFITKEPVVDGVPPSLREAMRPVCPLWILRARHAGVNAVQETFRVAPGLIPFRRWPGRNDLGERGAFGDHRRQPLPDGPQHRDVIRQLRVPGDRPVARYDHGIPVDFFEHRFAK